MVDTGKTFAGADVKQLAFAFDNIVLFICAILVVFMQSGFAMVEAGLNSAKNAINILGKNLMDFCFGVILFYLVGYGLMYSGNYAKPVMPGNGYFGFGGFGLYEYNDTRFTPEIDFFFQVAFAATAATIVSGAVAGRIKFSAYIVYTLFITGLVYPISGYWTWGGGWLKTDFAFFDFAGSAIVHAVGGFAGLAGAIVLGPRIGRYSPDGTSMTLPPHNMTLAGLGVFILIIGWYGFNPGSQLAFSDVSNTFAVGVCTVNTTLAACAGGVLGLITGWIMLGKPDISMALNGVLGGLVGITANCAIVSSYESMAIGGIAGVLVVLATFALEKCKIDDPVGAFPVHGLCGVWGVIAAAIFGDPASGVTMKGQVVGAVAIAAWAFIFCFILFSILKAMGQLRVTAEEEEKGLDISEHGMHAYIH
jgi:Amt family ammonium transporter